MIVRSCATFLVAILVAHPAAATDAPRPDACAQDGLRLQVLGSGDADLTDGRAASSYLVWVDGKSRLLIDAGSGSALRFGQSGAHAADLDAVLLTRVDAAHALALPAVIDSAQREGRRRALPLYGPTGSRTSPSTVTFVRTLLDGTRGAYRELSAVLNPLAKGSFKLQPHDVRTRAPSVGVRRNERDVVELSINPRIRAAATYLGEKDQPALAWRIRIGEQNIVIGGEFTEDSEHLDQLASEADLLIADVDETQTLEDAKLIGRFAARVKAKQLVVAPRIPVTAQISENVQTAIRESYGGPLTIAADLDCFAVSDGAAR